MESGTWQVGIAGWRVRQSTAFTLPRLFPVHPPCVAGPSEAGMAVFLVLRPFGGPLPPHPQFLWFFLTPVSSGLPKWVRTVIN